MNPTTQSPDVVTDKKPVQIWLDKLKKIPKKHLTSTLCVTLVAVGGFQGYSLFFVEEDAVPLTTTVSYGQLGTTIEGSGTATSAQTQSISAASNSEILGVYVSPGDTVEAGQLLYIQDDTELDELIEDYEAQIAEHQSTIADYYATIAEYQSDISDLQEDINNASIKASFHGKVTEISHKVGDNVNSGNQLAQLTDSSKMEVVLYFSYAYENDISIGDSATISIAEQMLVLTGTVTNIKKVEYITTEGTRCFAVTISVQNPNSLQAGTEVSATIGSIYPVKGGALDYVSDLSVNAPMTGEITGIFVDNYENVVSGQTLFTLNSDGLQDQIQTNLDRIETTNAQITATQAKIDGLYEDITETEASRSNFMVFSEISGKIITMNLTEGGNINQVQTAVSIYNMDSMQFSANIDELDMEHIHQGMEVEVTYASSSSTQTFSGEITAISFEATNENGVAYFPITITVDSQGALASGVNLSYRISVGDVDEGYLVGIDALKSYDGGTCVYVKGSGTSEIEVEDLPKGYYAIPVEVISSDSQNALIKEGLEEGMELFTRYQATAPTSGDSTSQMGGTEMDMDAMMAMRDEMMASGTTTRPNTTTGTTGTTTGPGNRGG